jgi:hypothetical protein
MTTGSIEVGELLCEVVVNFTKITDYGVSLPEFMSGSVAIPPEGARFDAAYQGTFLGPRISGTVEGVDYLHIRADGRFDLHIHSRYTTVDGQNISQFADGVGTREDGTNRISLRENASYMTSSPLYKWLNCVQVWGIGTVDVDKNEVRINYYVA